MGGKSDDEILEELLDKNIPTGDIEPNRAPLADYLRYLLMEKKVCTDWRGCTERKSSNKRITCELRGVCQRKQLASVGQILSKAEINAAFGYQIFNGKRVNPSRDKIIRLAFGFEMDFEEAQKLLLVARKPLLFGDDVARDKVLIRAFVCGYSLASVQATLLAKGMPLLAGDG